MAQLSPWSNGPSREMVRRRASREEGWRDELRLRCQVVADLQVSSVLMSSECQKLKLRLISFLYLLQQQQANAAKNAATYACMVGVVAPTITVAASVISARLCMYVVCEVSLDWL